MAISIKLCDGKEIQMSLTMPAIRKFEEKFGVKFDNWPKNDDGKPKDFTSEQVEYMFWLMLKPKNKNITEEEAGDLMEVENLPTIQDAIVTLIKKLGGTEKNSEAPTASETGPSVASNSVSEKANSNS